jgi:CHAD domain-containing protein
MTAGTPSLQPDGGEALDVQRIVMALLRHFSVTVGPPRTVLRVLVDTFDRRLRAAGLQLEHDRAAGREVLSLSRDGAPPVSTAVEKPRWPAFAQALPPGPIRDAVSAPASIRALTVVAREKRRLQLLELRNSYDKTVARIELDEPAEKGSGRPPAVTVRELRGYGDEADRATEVLRRLGLRPAPEDLAGAGAVGGTPVIDRQQPAGLLLGTALGGFLQAMDTNLPGLLDDIDTEFLHDFRVAVRRTRATLKLGRPALPDEMRERWEPAFKWLGDLTTPVRDLDVYQLDLPIMAGWLVAADAADLGPLVDHLDRRRTANRRALVRGLRSARYQDLRTQWGGVVERLAEEPEEAGLTAGELADRAIRRASRRVLRDGGAVHADSPATDLHDLRKRCKELRYALEVFAPVVDSTTQKKAIGDLKDLQDVLGRFQDTEVQRHALRDFAEEMMADGTSAQAVLAMGELIGHLDAEQDRARAEFEGTFARFARPTGVRRLERLGSGR